MTSGMLLIYLFLQTLIIDASHFRGGCVVWRPLNNTPSGSTVTIQVRQRWSYRRSFYSSPCTSATISAGGLLGDTSNLACSSGNCSSWVTPTTQTTCTDFSALWDLSSGEISVIQTIPLNIQFSVTYSSSAWFTTLVVGSGSSWTVTGLINTVVRPDGYINSSPIPVTLPIIYKPISVQQVHVVQTVDFDGSDIVRCRWSTASGNVNSYDECGGVCSAVPGATLNINTCTLTFTLTQASFYVAVALQVEDYYNSAATVPMSSVPLQFLFYGYATPSGCATPPVIIGTRPNHACISVPIGVSISETIIIQVLCPGKSIVDLVSVSPVGMTKGAITNTSPNIYTVSLSWIPTAAQAGPQGLCAGAVDNTSLQSEQWCMTYLVGVSAPDLVQSTASPVGVIPRTQTVFQIQGNRPTFRPTRNGTYIYFWDATMNGSLLQRFDCGWASEVAYTQAGIVITFPTAPWIPGHSYYVTFDSGVASGAEACRPESSPVTSTTFWTFTVAFPTTTSVFNASNTTSTTTILTTTTTTPSNAIGISATCRFALFVPMILIYSYYMHN